MVKFSGVPYPIQKDPKGYFRKQSDLDQIKSDLLILLLTNPGERCLTGDTTIPLANGTEVCISDLVGKDPFWVYSFDINSGKILPGLATAHRTAINAELIEVVIDNDQKVRCTSNHLWLMRDGSYRRADELCSGDSLMPLYRNLNTSGYEREKLKLAWEKRRLKNHKVKSINVLAEKEDCYDLFVEKYHNFALSAGVFVHNCMLPEYGTDLRSLIFEQNDTILAGKARDIIIAAIRQWEPRVTIQQLDVFAGPDTSSLSPHDDQTESEHILTIRINFVDPENIQEVQDLTLTVPLG